MNAQILYLNDYRPEPHFLLRSAEHVGNARVVMAFPSRYSRQTINDAHGVLMAWGDDADRVIADAVVLCFERQDRKRPSFIRRALKAMGVVASVVVCVHLTGDLGLRVSDNVARAAAEYCGRC